jgi:outer membrane immunogenic protein
MCGFWLRFILIGAAMTNSNRILSAAIAVSAMLGMGAASAADLAVKAMPVAAPVFTWTGCYVGVHAGAGVLHDQGYQPNGQILADDRHGVGGLAGGQVGCNYQTGMLVLGVEGEGYWSGMTINVDQFGFGTLSNTLVASASIKNRWDYDVAGRFGVAFDRALVYGKAGWTFGRFDWNATPVPCGTFCTTDKGSATLDGLLIGLGLEYAFTNNWTAKFEYDYLGFGAKNVGFTTTCPTCGVVTTTRMQNVSADKHIFKLGVNYLFNLGGGAVVAKY